jgi:regulatory protein
MNDPLNISLRFLKFRPRSVFEVTQKLKSKKISDSEIKNVIAVLKRNKLLDDGHFAKMWVGDRNLLKPKGAFVLKMELRKLGVSQSDIDWALAGQDEAEQAKKALLMKYRDREIDYEKKVAFLQRRGFSTGIIYKVLKEEHD